MSGTPTQAEIQAQWRAAIDIIEQIRSFADGTIAGAGAKIDILMQSLEGEYTPGNLSNWAAGMRSGLASLVTPGTALSALQPILYEYGRYISSQGQVGGYRNLSEVWSAIYEWFQSQSLTVESRAITFDTAGTPGAGNVGNGSMARLTVDAYGFALEACHVEAKTIRCRADQNSGTEVQAEAFEVMGSAASFDALLRSSFGSGESIRTTLVSRHAGSGTGGSLLTNSSFSEYSASATPKFTAWTESAGGASLTQDTTNYYRSHPGSQVSASMKITGGAGTVTVKQPIADSRVRRLDPNTPYFLRVMLNKTIGTAVGGSVNLRLGGQTVTVTIAALAAGWAELLIPMGTGCWFRNFNDDPMDIEIEWATSTSGYLLVDDAIFAPMDLIDGTYWMLRANAATHVPWMVDDTIKYTDTGGAPATAKIQWWAFVSGLGYLPSTTGVPTFTEP